jgi:antitoxin (DNA-binding transcriptional repressor) of toxin-antitoxin stability system
MRFVTVRELRNRAGKLWGELAEEKDMVLTSNGRPIALLSSISDDSVEESLAAVRRARAMAAVQRMQSQSMRAGLNKLRPHVIEAEIRAARKARNA